ncbi:MAG: hypothetical protein M3Q36_03380 [bacterium]|nr:hypothetical protein [bacterium]
MATKDKNTKKAKVDSGKTVIFAVVTIASILVVGLMMVSKGLWSQASYMGRVADKKEMAVQQLEANKSAIDALKASYLTFVSQNPNLLGGNLDNDSDRDGTNATLVLDALPSKYDFPAVASSLEKLLFGYEINSVSGAATQVVAAAAPAPATTDTTAAAGTPVAVAPVVPVGPVEIPFSFEVTTDYAGFRKLIDSFKRSIRPFHITKVELNGTNAELDVMVEGKTYYQQEGGLKIVSEDVK